MTFVKKIASAFKKLFTSAPAWSQVLSGALSLAAPLIETIVTLLAGAPAEALAAKIIAEVQAGFATAKQLIEDAHNSADTTTVQKIETVLSDITANLALLLTAGCIKDTKLQTEISAVVNLVINEIKAMLGELPLMKSSSTASGAATANA